jgi:hypothetical protein
MGALVEGKPHWTVGVISDHRLDEFAEAARRLVALIEEFDERTIDALNAAGWHSGQTFALRAELVRAVEVAEKVMRGRLAAPPRQPS